MIHKYPETFMDKDEDGSCTMFHKLQKCWCYLKWIESHIMADCFNYQDLPFPTISTNNEDNWKETYDKESFQKYDGKSNASS